MADVNVTFLGTGAGNCIYRNHTAIVLDCPDGTRLLLDGSSGNSLLRQGAAVGIMATDFDQVLLTHNHADHMGGLPFLQGQRTMVNPDGPPLRIYSTDESLESLRSLCEATRMRSISVDREGAKDHEGRPVFQWLPTLAGHSVELGTSTHATSFMVDHVDGAVGWRVECNGISVVFSGDTIFSNGLVKAAKGAQLLIHEALTTGEEGEATRNRLHSTSADAGRAAAMASVKELIMTHIDSSLHADTQPLIDDARKYFDGRISVAHDLYTVSVGNG
jgi:ribonuclease Z